MAKNSDQRAGGFETENTGGVLSGLLADEEHFDRRAMFRLGAWGVVSVGAVVVAALASQNAMKLRHDDVAAVDLARQSQQIQSVAKESQNETRRLAAAIDTLNGDRDRMYSRLTTLEQGLDSVTGAIAKQGAVAAIPAATPPAAAPVGPPAPLASAVQPVAQTTAPEPAPAIAPVTTSVAPVTTSATAMPATEKPRAEAKKPAPPAPVTAAAIPVPAPLNPPSTTSAEPPMAASKSSMAPPDAAAVKPIEPESSAETAAATPPSASPAPMPVMTPAASAPSPAPEVARSTPAADKLAAAEPPPSGPAPLAVNHTEFGVDVGGANSVGGLRALWRGLLKSRSNAPLAALQPIIVIKERDNGLGMQLRLVAGPLSDAAAAARICAAIAEKERSCETTVFDGQRLAMKAEDAPATTEAITAKPSSEKPESSEKPSDPASEKFASDKSSAKPGFSRQGSHRRSYSYSRRAPVEQTPQPPPQQSSALSWFRLRSQ